MNNTLGTRQSSKLVWADVSCEDPADTMWLDVTTDAADDSEVDSTASSSSQVHGAVAWGPDPGASLDTLEEAINSPAEAETVRSKRFVSNVVRKGVEDDVSGGQLPHVQLPSSCRVEAVPARYSHQRSEQRKQQVCNSSLPIGAGRAAVPTLQQRLNALRSRVALCGQRPSPFWNGDLCTFARTLRLDGAATRSLEALPWELQLEIIYQFRPSAQTRNSSARFVSFFHSKLAQWKPAGTREHAQNVSSGILTAFVERWGLDAKSDIMLRNLSPKALAFVFHTFGPSPIKFESNLKLQHNIGLFTVGAAQTTPVIRVVDRCLSVCGRAPMLSMHAFVPASWSDASPMLSSV